MTLVDQHTVTVTVDGQGLPVESADITLDRGWAPRVQGQVILAGSWPIDPRQGTRARVQFRQTFGRGTTLAELDADLGDDTLADIDTAWAGMTLAQIDATYTASFNAAYRPDTAASFNLGIRSASYDQRRDETTLRVASDEAIAQDYRLVEAAPVGFGLDVRSTVEQALAYIGARLAPGVITGTLEEAPAWAPGQTLWDFLTPLVEYAGLLLYCDEARVWHLIGMNTTTPGELTLSDAVQLTEAERLIDRDDDAWAQAVVVEYTWRDDLNIDRTRYDVAGDVRAGKAIFLKRERTRYPGPGAAAQILARVRRRGLQLPVEAVSNYATRPGMALTVAVGGLDPQLGRVKRVMFTTDWRMQLDGYDYESVEENSINSYPAGLTINELVGTIREQQTGSY